MKRKVDVFNKERLRRKEAMEERKRGETRNPQFGYWGDTDDTEWASPKSSQGIIGAHFIIGSKTNHRINDETDLLAETTWTEIRHEFKANNKDRYKVYTPKLGRRERR